MMTDFACSAGWDPQSIVLYVSDFVLNSLLFPSVLHRQLFPYEQMRFTYIASHLCYKRLLLLKLFNNLYIVPDASTI
jgi:hypothetical protein